MFGMKPPQFAVSMFCQLGASAGDGLVDLYLGSGAITAARERYTASTPAVTGKVVRSGIGRKLTPVGQGAAVRPAESRTLAADGFSIDKLISGLV